MTIAVNTRFLVSDQLEGYGYFLFETLKRITTAHPEHNFVFIFDRPYDQRFIFSPNITPVVKGPAARHPLLWKWWFDLSVPRILKKYKADVFVSTDGFCSLRTHVPQCLVIHDLAFLHYPAFNKRSHSWFYKKYTPRFLARAGSIATVSDYTKQDILKNYPVNAAGIDIVYNGVREIFKPLSTGSKEEVKKKYTEGREYFVYTGAIHPRKNLVNLLKAFSVFKKRQQSNMQLVLAGRLAWKYGSFLEKLKSYKYRDDVVMTGYLDEEELAKLTAAAYAMVYSSLFEGFGLPVVEAMRSGVAVITSAGTAMEEIAAGAALLADPTDHLAIAEQMMRIYKDENLRNELIQKGKQVATRYNWDKTAEMLWQTIIKAVDRNALIEMNE